jgi:hypothetical protein
MISFYIYPTYRELAMGSSLEMKAAVREATGVDGKEEEELPPPFFFFFF